MNTHASLIFKLIALAVIACVPLSGESFYIEIIGKVLVMAIFAMSLDLLVGFTGLVSFGHAAYFGIAAYAVALFMAKFESMSLWLVLPASVALSALAAFLIGLFVLRTKGIYFIMVTMAFAQMLFFLVFDNKELNVFGLFPLKLGGSDGVYINFKPDAGLFDLENKRVFYYFVLACLVLVYVFLRRLLWSPLGRATDILQDPVLTGIAHKHQITVPQVVLRWHIQHGLVAIPRSSHPQRIAENLDIFDFELSDEQMELIDSMDESEPS
mgnify:CR=1 FL=1